MKFKHTFHVFVDNFSVIYKQLLYRFVVAAIAFSICFLGVYPYVKAQLNSPEFNALATDWHNFLDMLVKGEFQGFNNLTDTLAHLTDKILALLSSKVGEIFLCGFLLLLVYFVATWFNGLANYATAAVINDKMAMHSKSPFLVTLIRTLKSSTVLNLIYVPLTMVYDLLVGVGMFYLIYALVHSFLPLLVGLFLFVVVIILAIALKMTFVCDWLPAVIRGKKKQGEAILYTFSRKGKSTMNVYSNFLMLILFIFGLNMAALICTVGAGLLITVPASYVLLLCFEFVTYYDREEIKYFIGVNTVVNAHTETNLTREEFFRGEGE